MKVDTMRGLALMVFVHWQDLHFRFGWPSYLLPLLRSKPRMQAMQPPTSVTLTKQLGQATSELQHIARITSLPISHSSLEQNSRRDVISFLAAGPAEGVAPSSWLKVGTCFSLPTVVTFRLPDDGDGEGWWWSTVGAFPGESVSSSETSCSDFSAVGASFFLKNSSLLLAFRLRVEGVGFFFFFWRDKAPFPLVSTWAEPVKQKQ